MATTTIDVQTLDIRGDYRRLTHGNRLLEALITLVTGKAGKREVPLIELGPYGSYAANLIELTALIGIGWALLTITPFVATVVLLPYVLVAITGRLRAQQVVFAHHAIHQCFGKGRWINDFIADVATTIVFAQNPNEYEFDHIRLHHSPETFTSRLDADGGFIYELGFRPGMSKSQLWAVLWRTFFSPSFHYSFAVSRLRSTFVTSKPRHRLIAILWSLCLVGLALTMSWWSFILIILIPLGPGYAVSALLQFLTEHKWLVTPSGKMTPMAYRNACWGRFCSDPLPKSTLTGAAKIRGWSAWILRMLVVHIPTRLGVLIGDMPSHDWHHLIRSYRHSPRAWTKANYMRQLAIDDGDPAGLATRELWGIGVMIDTILDSLSKAPE